MGFERVATVEEVGQFALRGGILDIFGFGTPEPARVEFWGDEIESIRHFDILTQLSVGSVEELRILPVDVKPPPRSDPGHPRGGRGRARSLSPTCPAEAVLVRLDGDPTATGVGAHLGEVHRLHEAERKAGGAPEAPERLFLPAGRGPPAESGFPQLFVGDPARRPEPTG
jgi:hypothetical protein